MTEPKSSGPVESKQSSRLPAKNGRIRTLLQPVRTAIFHGLGVVLPPLLTLIVLIWAFQLIQHYVFEPVRSVVRIAIVAYVRDVKEERDFWPDGKVPPAGDRAYENPILHNNVYQRLPDGEYVPREIYDRVMRSGISRRDLVSADQVYRAYVDLRYLQAWKAAIVFVCVFILILYFLGKFVGAGMGRLVWARMEAAIVKLPVVRSVYSAVKQVSDFLLTEPQITASRVVAVEWPQKGSWALGFVTSEGMKDVRGTAKEPILTVFIPTSPMPMTGFTLQVKKSSTVDLGLTLEDAFQFIVSCGVVIPPHQLQRFAPAPSTEPPAVELSSPIPQG